MNISHKHLTNESPVQYLEQRLAELQHGNAKQHLGLGSPNPKHEEMLDIVATSITNHLTTNLFYSHSVLQHRAKLFYPSERPPLKIPIQGVYYDAHPRSAGQEYATQFSHFNAGKMPLDVARRLFENYKDNILPRFPCFVEADLTHQFSQFYHDFADDQARSNTTHFVITVILAISSLSSKRHDFRKVAALTESLHADAMRHMGFLSDASITSLQCLLLLIQLALLFPHTGNLWYLSGEAMRMAVGLGLHQELDSTMVSSSIHVELRRRIFWVVSGPV